jgi:hypothetical protein
MAVTASILWMAAAPDLARSEAAPGRFREMVLAPHLWLLGLVQMGSFGLSLVVDSWVVVILTKVLNVPATQAGLIGSLVLLAGIVSRPLGGALRRYHLPCSVMDATQASEAQAPQYTSRMEIVGRSLKPSRLIAKCRRRRLAGSTLMRASITFLLASALCIRWAAAQNCNTPDIYVVDAEGGNATRFVSPSVAVHGYWECQQANQKRRI